MMDSKPQAVIARVEDRERESWGEASRGLLSWFTLFSSDMTPTQGMCAGVAEIPPKGSLNPHRHEQAEIYFLLEGEGILFLDGVEQTVTAGAGVFIPGNTEHGIRNETDRMLRLFYVFPTDSFGDVIYRFPNAG